MAAAAGPGDKGTATMQEVNLPGNARPLHRRNAPQTARACRRCVTGRLVLAAILTAINLTLTLLLLTLA